MRDIVKDYITLATVTCHQYTHLLSITFRQLPYIICFKTAARSNISLKAY